MRPRGDAVTALRRTVREDTAIDARDILRGQTSARSALGDQIYILRLTKTGKLILTK